MSGNKNESVVIAGSDGDIGKIIADYFVTKGINVIGLSRAGHNKEGLKAVFCLDLADFSAVASTAREIFEKFGPTRCLINAAGMYKRTLENGSDAEVMANNYGVAENLLKSFVPLMENIGDSRIITIGSIDSRYPNINSFSYSVAKGAIRTLVDLYKRKYRNASVNFDLISPGAVNTRIRKEKQENKEALVQPRDIAILCHALFNLGSNAAVDEIFISPKSFTFS